MRFAVKIFIEYKERRVYPMKLVSEQDKKTIRIKYPYTDTEELAELLGFSPNAIKQWARKLGVKKQKGYVFHNCGKFTKEQKKFLHQNYSTIANEELSKILNVSVEDILSYACSKGLKKRADLFLRINGSVDFFKSKRQNAEYHYETYLGNQQEPKIEQLYKSSHGKYAVNQNYFEKIDNEWKAYWLGFLYADGWICSDKCVLGLTLCLSDADHVQKFKDSLQAENKIYYTEPKEMIVCGRQVHSQGQARININNQKLCDDLNALGCVARKTLVLQFPTLEQVPEHLMRHFIRGFFDGDGWVYVNKKKGVPSIGFVGIPQFINKLQSYLVTKLDLTWVKPRQKPNAKTIEIDWVALTDVEKLYNYFYNDANIYLPRKFDRLNKFYCLGQYEV